MSNRMRSKVPPKITEGPIRHLTVCRGGTFQLKCSAIGFPTPFINWRLNWGHVCSEPRCCMSQDEHGNGVLTVTEARHEDAGAYSCEAFSSNGREFAVPDAQVAIVDGPCGPSSCSVQPCHCGSRKASSPLSVHSALTLH